MNNAIEDALNFASNQQQVIEDATVYTERVVDTGSYYVTRYYGLNKELVEKYAKARFNGTDSYRSPSLSNGGNAQLIGKYWSVTLTNYGLD